MSTYTAQQAAAAVEQAPDIRFRDLVPTGHGSGVVLSERPDAPAVLGFAVVDTDGKYAILALSASEVEELRDALSAWLDEPLPPGVSGG